MAIGILHRGTPDLETVLLEGNDAGAEPITGLEDPTNPQDAATKAYVDAAIPATPDLEAVLTAGESAGDHNISDLADPLFEQDAATRAYVDGAILAAPAPALGAVLAVGNDAGGLSIENLADPAANQDAATKSYVDATVPAAIMWRPMVTGLLEQYPRQDADNQPIFVTANGDLVMVGVPI
jgi:hypothetical protein